MSDNTKAFLLPGLILAFFAIFGTAYMFTEPFKVLEVKSERIEITRILEHQPGLYTFYYRDLEDGKIKPWRIWVKKIDFLEDAPEEKAWALVKIFQRVQPSKARFDSSQTVESYVLEIHVHSIKILEGAEWKELRGDGFIGSYSVSGKTKVIY